MATDSEKPNPIAPPPKDDGIFSKENGSKEEVEVTQVSALPTPTSATSGEDNRQAEHDLLVTEDDLLEAKQFAAGLSLMDVRKILKRVYKIHERDPNFPHLIIEKIREFINNEEVFNNPEKHEQLIDEMRLEAALITNNSPYAEVRSVVDNHDDPTTPCSTIRAWVIGITFSILGSFVNQLFSVRQPPIGIGSNVIQLLAYPCGKFLDHVLPDWGFTLFGTRHSLNPGPFNRKEHMLITIMAQVGISGPYTAYIIWIQVLPSFYNQQYARSFLYQILIAISTNFIGYGMAGLCRRFLVYPVHCVWPASLVTIALNTAFHTEKKETVRGPFKSTWTLSRVKYFYLAFALMFVYFWFPGYIFGALSLFSWLTWIAPDNLNLNTITGFNNGLGLNPWPTFDWNIVTFMVDPLIVPFFTTFNNFMGAFGGLFIIAAMWYSNAYNTGYLPINDNHVYDHFGSRYNVSRVVDDRGMFDPVGYEQYSPPFLTAANIVVYMFFFATYSATVTYAYLYHRHEIALGVRALFSSFKGIPWPWKRGAAVEENREKADEERLLDVHNRLMRAYPEVPEWWYLLCLAIAIACGIGGIAGYETYTSPGVVFYGLALCIVFVVPIGIITAVTGMEVTLNVLAEFIGGSIVEGNALAMNFFKSFGYVTTAHAIGFSNDLKLAHYVKIPPRHTFAAQMMATLVSTFVSVGVQNFQVNGIEGICTPQAKFRLTCPGVNTFFTASVMWGTVGPRKMWGVGGQYSETLVGFGIGVALVLFFWVLAKQRPNWVWLRSVHPVILLAGPLGWAPYSLSYVWPGVPVAWLSWLYMRKRFLGWWSKYNFVTSAAFSCAIAICGLIIFFTLQWQDIELDWWGNSVVYQGCEGDACLLLELPDGEYFGPRIGEFH
jgi:OPT family small oligopeptide transporter